jgi:hypothetical protein
MGPGGDLIDGFGGAVVEPVHGTSDLGQRNHPQIGPRKTGPNTLHGVPSLQTFETQKPPLAGFSLDGSLAGEWSSGSARRGLLVRMFLLLWMYG